MRKIVILILLFELIVINKLNSNNCISIDNYCNLNIKLIIDNYNGYDFNEIWTYDRNIFEGNKIYYNDNHKLLTGNILDCRGELTFMLTDSTERIITKGQFINGLDTLKMQVYLIDPINLKDSIIVKKYIQPLASGNWTYSDFNNNLISTREYKNGILTFSKIEKKSKQTFKHNRIKKINNLF